MADVYVNALTTISTEPTTTDSLVAVNRNTNEGQIIDYNLLADKILEKLSSKTFSSLTTSSKLLPGAINELDSDVASLISSVGSKAHYITVSTTGAWDSSDAPEAFIAGMASTSRTYTGRIEAAAGTKCAAIGIKASDSSAAVLIFTYSPTVHFWVKWAGSWTDRTFNLN